MESQEQARLLRAGRIDAIDRENVAEEIESLGREQFNKLESALRLLLLHFLKWDHQPSLRSRSWMLSIAAQRLEIEDIIGDNPGLKPRIHEAIARAYRNARVAAARETDIELDRFPMQCPYWPGTRSSAANSCVESTPTAYLIGNSGAATWSR